MENLIEIINGDWYTKFVLKLRYDCEFDGVIAQEGTIVKTIKITGAPEHPEYVVEAFSGTRLVAQKMVSYWMVDPVRLLPPPWYHDLGLNYRIH